jgi:hypothetical protein
MMTVTTVDRSRGSLSIDQVNASVWLMNSVIDPHATTDGGRRQYLAPTR